MDPWDAALRAATILAVLAALPLGIETLARWAFADADADAAGRLARLGAAPGLVLTGALAGLTLLPPPYAHGPTSPLALVGALVGAAVAAAASLWPLGRPRALRRPALLAGAALGALPLLAIAAAWVATRVTADPRSVEAAQEARARVLVSPFDATAQLALGFDAGRRGDVEALAAHLDAAERARADEVATYELRAELEARRGDCEAARRAFDRALAIRMERAMAEVLERPLSVGDYALPEALVRLCGLSISGP